MTRTRDPPTPRTRFDVNRLVSSALALALLATPAAASAQSPEPSATTLLCIEVTGPVPADGFGAEALLAAIEAGAVTVTGAGLAAACAVPPADSASLSLGDTATIYGGTLTVDEVRTVRRVPGEKAPKGEVFYLAHVTFAAATDAVYSSPTGFQVYVGEDAYTWLPFSVPPGVGRDVPDAVVPIGRESSGWVAFRAPVADEVSVYWTGPEQSIEWLVPIG